LESNNITAIEEIHDNFDYGGNSIPYDEKISLCASRPTLRDAAQYVIGKATGNGDSLPSLFLIDDTMCRIILE
jgi:hypothetical protein